MYVFDATPLIYLAKATRLGAVSGLSTSAVIPNSVYTEVVTNGIEAGYPDARRIERAVEAGTFEVVVVDGSPVRNRLEANGALSEADASVLALAADVDGTAIMDERSGRVIADAEGIETRGTAFVILELLRNGSLSVDETRETIDEIVASGWYCAPDLYAKIIRKIEQLD